MAHRLRNTAVERIQHKKEISRNKQSQLSGQQHKGRANFSCHVQNTVKLFATEQINYHLHCTSCCSFFPVTKVKLVCLQWATTCSFLFFCFIQAFMYFMLKYFSLQTTQYHAAAETDLSTKRL